MPQKVAEQTGESAVEAVKASVVETAGQLSASLLGILNKVCGQIYAVLLLSPHSLSLDDIVAELGVSKGNVSVNIRLLEEYQLVRKVWVKNSRRDHYEAVKTVPVKVIREFLGKIRRNISEVLGVVERCQRELSTSPQTGNPEAPEYYLAAELERVGSFFRGASYLFSALYSGKSFDIAPLSALLAEEPGK